MGPCTGSSGGGGVFLFWEHIQAQYVSYKAVVLQNNSGAFID